MLPYTSIQSELFITSPLVVFPYTSIQSDLFTTSPLVVFPYTSIQSDLFTSPLVVLPYTSLVYSQTLYNITLDSAPIYTSIQSDPSQHVNVISP